MSYAELEPYYDKFERTAGVSGKAGNLRGAKQDGGNYFEQPRDRDYPLPALEPSYSQVLFWDAASEAGYHPFPRPCAAPNHGIGIGLGQRRRGELPCASADRAEQRAFGIAD